MGMAWTDQLRIAITPLPTVDTKSFPDDLKQKLDSGDVGIVVFGYPTHSDGQPTRMAKSIDLMCDKLRKTYPHIEVAIIDEAFSSKDARTHLISLGKKKKFRERKGHIDQASAVLMLKEFLDQNT